MSKCSKCCSYPANEQLPYVSKTSDIEKCRWHLSPLKPRSDACSEPTVDICDPQFGQTFDNTLDMLRGKESWQIQCLSTRHGSQPKLFHFLKINSLYMSGILYYSRDCPHVLQHVLESMHCIHVSNFKGLVLETLTVTLSRLRWYIIEDSVIRILGFHSNQTWFVHSPHTY